MKRFTYFSYLILLLVSCGDDNKDNISITTPDGKDDISATAPEKRKEVSTVYELGVCNEQNTLDSVFVSKENSLYVCNGIEWQNGYSNNTNIIFSSSSTSGFQTDNIMVDSRDGQTYRTVVIGSQTWMAENLNFNVPNSFVATHYDYEYTGEKFGRYYTWSTAMDSAGLWSANGMGCGYGKSCVPVQPVQGVCPQGWHIPSNSEWNDLFEAVGGKAVAGNMLKSKNFGGHTDGSDSYGFSVAATGYCIYSPSAAEIGYCSNGDGASFWSSTDIDNLIAACIEFKEQKYNVLATEASKGNSLYPVRCLKNEGNVWSGIVENGYLTDSRDNQTYKTVKIGKQTWMAQNMNYETANSFCYNDNPDFCVKYGHLYTRDVAHSICPTGWHLPSKDEWNVLFTIVGGEYIAGVMLKSPNGWSSNSSNTCNNCSDKYSFSILPAGGKMLGSYSFESDYAYFWSSTDYDNSTSYIVEFNDNSVGHDRVSFDNTFGINSGAFSVRCVMN